MSANKETSMAEHSMQIIWTFLIPPGNERRVVIEKRVDGPFRRDIYSTNGCYYVFEEQLIDGRWVHIPWSTKGVLNNAEVSWDTAERIWRERVAANERKNHGKHSR